MGTEGNYKCPGMENQKLIHCILAFFIFASVACQEVPERNVNVELQSKLRMDSILAPVLISNINISNHNKSALPLWSKYQKKNGNKVSAIRIYPDGEIYFWQKKDPKEENSPNMWVFISKVNENGLSDMEGLISEEFFQLASNNNLTDKGKLKTILWVASLNGHTHATKTYSLPYSKLPEVIGNIQKAYNSNIIPRSKLNE